MVQFRLLGPLEAQDGERRVELGRPKQRVLLAVLLVHANDVVSLDRLIEELWGQERSPARHRVRPVDRPVRLALRWRRRSRNAPRAPRMSWSGGMISSLHWMGSWPTRGAGAAG